MYTSSSEFVRSRWILINATMQGKRGGRGRAGGKVDLFLEIFGERERKVGLRNRTERIFFLSSSFFSLGENRWRRVAKNRRNPLYFLPQITLFYCFFQGQIFFAAEKRGICLMGDVPTFPQKNKHAITPKKVMQAVSALPFPPPFEFFLHVMPGSKKNIPSPYSNHCSSGSGSRARKKQRRTFCHIQPGHRK